MRRLRGLAAFTATALLALGAPATGSAQELTLSVAISMKEAVETLGRSFAARQPGVTLRYNFGASGDLQKQIEAGAPIDVFVSAATRQMDDLEQKGLILGDTRRAFARNVLVVVDRRSVREAGAWAAAAPAATRIARAARTNRRRVISGSLLGRPV